MLTTYLNGLPYTKFVLIEDTVQTRGTRVLEYLLKNHAKRSDYSSHLFIVERDYNRIRAKYPTVSCHDFTSDPRGWFTENPNFHSAIANIPENSVIFIDSLAHLVFNVGLAQTYAIFSELMKKNIQQVVTILHTDLVEEKEAIILYFHHLATLYMELDQTRVSYTYKKSARKIIKQIEEFRFENDRFITEPITKPDPVETAINETIPENMSTFKISLSQKDKESRSHLILPYLPKDSQESKIHYTFDAIDDWDEEDPDDDLDI